MRPLKEHSLDFNISLDYFTESLKDVNQLSNAILEYVNFKEGDFFTLLPDEANIDRIYKFSEGGILRRGKMTKITVLNFTYNTEIINSIKEEMSSYLYRLIKKIKNQRWFLMLLIYQLTQI